MSTRSLIAVRSESGIFGRYCHFDGYPDHMLPELEAIVKRDGADKAAATFLAQDRGGWRSVDSNSKASGPDSMENGPDTLKIAGYGEAYRDCEPDLPLRFEDCVKDVFIEYAYVIDLNESAVEAFEFSDGDFFRVDVHSNRIALDA